MTESFPALRAQTARFTNGAPHGFRILDEQGCVLFLQSDGPFNSSQRIMRLDLTAGASASVLVDPDGLTADDSALPDAERQRRERLRESASGITAFDTCDDGRLLTFALGGVVHVADVASGDVFPIADSVGAVDPRLNPTGTHVAWVQDDNLWCASVAEQDAHALTSAEPGHTWGLPNFLAAEEFDRNRGFWWSPDGRELLVEHVDETRVDTRYLSDPSAPTTPPRSMRYPAAGTNNPRARLWRVSVAGDAQEIHFDHQKFEYLVSVHWSRRGPALITLYDRPQTRSDVFAVNGNVLTSISSATDPDWVSDVPGTPNWTSNGQLITTHRDAQSETVAFDGAPIEIPGRHVTAVLAVLADGVIIQTAASAPTRRVEFVNHAGETTLLAGTPDGYYSATFSDTASVIAYSDLTGMSATRQVRKWEPGSAPTLLSAPPDLSMVPPVALNLTDHELGPDKLHTVVAWPAGHTPGSGRLPVIMNPYGGPHAQRVLASGRLFAHAQWLADQGYAVVIADGHGSPGRGPAWERSIKGDLATKVLADQVCVLRELANQYPDDIDRERVGITGWSFGGYLAALAVLQAPDVFRCAVAGAPVTEWRWYDTAYTERYLGTPQNNASNYDESSLLPLANQLRRPLMLIHGLADDNVYAQHSLALSALLTANGSAHTFLPLPNVSHMTPQVEIAENLLTLELDFFNQHLHS